jgi:hypothetical protein
MIGFFFAARAISMSDLNSAMRLSFRLALEKGTDREDRRRIVDRWTG